MTWTQCPNCTRVGILSCTKCLGVGGWYTSKPSTDIDQLLSSRPATKADKPTSHVITAETMTNNLALELLNELDLGDWEVSQWEAGFIDSCLRRETFSIKQKAVIHKMAVKFKLL